MAATANEMDWDALLQQSEELAARVSFGRAGGAVFFARRCDGARQKTRTPLTRLPTPLPHTQDSHGFPRVERDLLQVERYAAALRARVARADAGSDAAAAARLLAAEGVNTRK